MIEINKLYAVLSKDEIEEGICAVITTIGVTPLIAGNNKYLEGILRSAQEMANEKDITLTLYEFTGKTKLKTIEPES